MSFTNLPYFNLQTTNYTLLYSDDVVQFNCSSGSLVATLPTAVGYGGKRLTIRRAADATPANTLTINTTSSQTIDTRASGSIHLQPSDYAVVMSDGSNWQIITIQETVFAFCYISSTSQTPGANVQFNFDTKIVDTHGAVTTGAAAWKFTAPQAGTYRVEYLSNLSSGTAGNIYLYKSNVQTVLMPNTYGGVVGTNSSAGGSTTFKLAANDFIDLRPTSSAVFAGQAAAPYFCWITITKIGN
jgi:hypothetical protein